MSVRKGVLVHTYVLFCACDCVRLCARAQLCVCVCVRACVRVRSSRFVRARACVRVCE